MARQEHLMDNCSIGMKACIFGAGASIQAGYPLASCLLHSLSDWLDTNPGGAASARYEPRWSGLGSIRTPVERPQLDTNPGGAASAFWVERCQNRILQIRETFGSLDSLENVLAKLEQCGTQRVVPTSLTTYAQDCFDIAHDTSEYLMGRALLDDSPRGFYPQYMRSDLVPAFREMFPAFTAQRRTAVTNIRAAGNFPEERLGPHVHLHLLEFEMPEVHHGNTVRAGFTPSRAT
jgi:hypothetical protein